MNRTKLGTRTESDKDSVKKKIEKKTCETVWQFELTMAQRKIIIEALTAFIRHRVSDSGKAWKYVGLGISQERYAKANKILDGIVERNKNINEARDMLDLMRLAKGVRRRVK